MFTALSERGQSCPPPPHSPPVNALGHLTLLILSLSSIGWSRGPGLRRAEAASAAQAGRGGCVLALTLSLFACPTFGADLSGNFHAAGDISRSNSGTLTDSLGGNAGFGLQTAGSTELSGGFLASLNVAPEARNLSAQRSAGSHLKISIAKLLALGRDADGDRITLDSFDATSSSGARVFRDGGWLIYLSADGIEADQFTYRLTDTLGPSLSGTVFIAIRPDDNAPSQNLLSITPEGTAMRLRFAGIPGVSYRIQTTPSLTPTSWTTLGNVVAGPDGAIEFLDPAPIGDTRFYRTVFP